MTTEELLKPRYKVIADWPGVAGKVLPDQILSLDDEFIPDLYWCGGEAFTEGKLRDYPHLFQKLEWWEERDHSELPDYLKVISGDFTDDYNKIGKVDFYKRNNVCIKFKSNNMSYRPIGDTIPATKDEFETA